MTGKSSYAGLAKIIGGAGMEPQQPIEPLPAETKPRTPPRPPTKANQYAAESAATLKHVMDADPTGLGLGNPWQTGERSFMQEVDEAPVRGVGRPPGRRSDPDYERLTALIRKTTRRKVEMKMLQQPESAKDFSELVDRLLDEWADGTT